MKRTLVVAACLAAVLAAWIGTADADPAGTIPISGHTAELSFSGTLTITGFAAVDGQLDLEGTLDGPLTGTLGQGADVTNLPVALPVDAVTPTCAPPQVTVVTAAALAPVPGFDAITLDSVALVRPVDAADTALVEQVCQAADLAGHGKLKGRRLTQAVDALNALGGTWAPVPVGPATAG